MRSDFLYLLIGSRHKHTLWASNMSIAEYFGTFEWIFNQRLTREREHLRTRRTHRNLPSSQPEFNSYFMVSRCLVCFLPSFDWCSLLNLKQSKNLPIRILSVLFQLERTSTAITPSTSNTVLRVVHMGYFFSTQMGWISRSTKKAGRRAWNIM